MKIVKEIPGKNMNARVVPARGVEGKLGQFEVTYEYSRKNNSYLYHLDRSGNRKTYASVKLATAAAKRIAW